MKLGLSNSCDDPSEISMKALRFGISIPRLLMGKALGRFTDSVVFGALSGLSLEEVPDPALPGPDWARLEVLMCGVCGSDIAGLTFKSSSALEPFLSFPAVLGHEVLARVVEVGPGVTRVKVGNRVSVDPSISCVVRGRAPGEQCASCAAGLPATCARAGETGGPSPNGTPLARGLLLGANSDLPGGFGERMVAHQSQLFPVRESIEDKLAVLTEPLSIGVHAVLQSHPDPATAALVIGSGPIAFSAVWALRALGHRGLIVAQTKRPNEAALARELGASDTAAPGAGARKALLDTGATAYQPIVGSEVFAGGGFPLVFDCVGSKESLDQALRFVTPRGKVILLGCAGQIGNVDLTFLWAREVQIIGFVGYGTESWRGERLHTFEVTHWLLSETRAPIAKLVSHSFPLAHYQDALGAAVHRGASGALKVLLTPN
jgi:threonine dehydrogenase-like Zn-dependent dehydrogenase